MIDQTFDRRLIERRIRNGQLTGAEYEKFLSTLDDAADNLETCEAVLGPEEPSADSDEAAEAVETDEA
jgi:hypothetical protein